MTAPFNTLYSDGGPPITGDGLNTFLQNVANVSDARGFVGTFGMVFYLQGTNAAGDGGQGMFVWNPTGGAADDNGVTTIVPLGSAPGAGEWSRLPGASKAALTTQVLSGSAIPVPNGTVMSAMSLVIPAGDWDVFGSGAFAGADLITTQCGFSTNPAALPDTAFRAQFNGGGLGSTALFSTAVPPQRFVLTTATTVYLTVNAAFSSGTCNFCGSILARQS